MQKYAQLNNSGLASSSWEYSTKDVQQSCINLVKQFTENMVGVDGLL